MRIYSYKDNQIIENDNLIEALAIKTEKVITLVGAGGKTSTIFRLGSELSSLNKKTIITTTTHMGLDDDFILVENFCDLKKVEDILNTKNLVKIGKKESDYKVKSLDCDLLKQAIKMANVVLIEGDGSKNLPLKAPKENEPVIIEETDLVIGLIGIDSLDKKIKDICHRSKLVSKLLKKNVDQNIEIEDLVKIATSKDALKKNVNCRYKVIINKVDDEKYLEKCKKIATLLQNFEIDVVFTSYIN